LCEIQCKGFATIFKKILKNLLTFFKIEMDFSDRWSGITRQSKCLKAVSSLKMSTVVKTAAAVEKKRPANKKRLILVEDLDVVVLEQPTSAPEKRLITVHELDVVVLEEPKADQSQPSIWMQMRRIPKVRTPIIWTGIEDISDDEDDTPQAAGRRLSQMKATRDRIQYRHHVNRLEDLQDAGLFLNW
jgi:hypothetical protein